MSIFKSFHHFCPTGFQLIKVGLIEVHMGRDPNDPGKMAYPHYNSVATLEVLGVDPHKQWRSLDVFRRELRAAAKKELTKQLNALSKELT